MNIHNNLPASTVLIHSYSRDIAEVLNRTGALFTLPKSILLVNQVGQRLNQLLPQSRFKGGKGTKL